MRRGVAILIVFPLVLATSACSDRDQGYDVWDLNNTEEPRSLIGPWLFFPGDDPGVAVEEDVSKIEFAEHFVPSQWHQKGHDFDGIGWYRHDFHVGDALAGRDLALTLPYTMAAHEVYVNGVQVGRGGKIGPGGDLVSGNMLHRAHLVPASLLRTGKANNILAIRVRSWNYIGGFIGPHMYIGPASLIFEFHGRHVAWSILLCGIFIFVTLMHLLSFAGRPKERQYLYFSAVSISAGSIAIGLDALALYAVDHHVFSILILQFGVTTLASWLALFFHRYFDVPVNLFVRITMVFSAVAFLTFVISIFIPRLYFLHSRIVIPFVLFLLMAMLVYCVVLTILAQRRGKFGAWIILPGFAAYAIAITSDALAYLQILHNETWHDEGLLAFVLSMAVAVSMQFSRTHKDLEQTYAMLEDSEKRYRNLIERTSDLVFTLDPRGRILMMNRAVHGNLGLRVHDLLGSTIYDLLYTSHMQRSLDRLNDYVMRQKIQDLLSSKGQTRFHTEFRTRLHEPREMEVELELLETELGDVISGRARALVEDELMRLRVSETQRYELGNYLNLAEVFAHYIGIGLKRYMDMDDAMSLKLALREIIINAIEHGNLDITFEEKTEAQAEGKYFGLLRERQQDPRYARRRVRIYYSLNATRARFTVRDEGKGFDHRKQNKTSVDDLNRDGLMHGRGIIYARTEFDRVQYNEVGNAVFLEKVFDARPDATVTG